MIFRHNAGESGERMKYKIENVQKQNVNEIAFTCDIVTSPDRIRVTVSGQFIEIAINPGHEIDFSTGEKTGRESKDYFLRIENNTGDIDISSMFSVVNDFIMITTGQNITIESIIEFIECFT